MGATFGGGSNTLFGAGGADNLLTRVTTVMAFLFMFTSVVLSSSLKSGSVTHGALYDSLPATTPITAPAPAAGGAPAPGTDAPASNTQGAAAPSGEPTSQPAAAPSGTSEAVSQPVAGSIEPVPAGNQAAAPVQVVPSDANPVAAQVQLPPVAAPLVDSPIVNSDPSKTLSSTGNPVKDVVTDAPPAAASSTAPKKK